MDRATSRWTHDDRAPARRPARPLRGRARLPLRLHHGPAHARHGRAPAGRPRDVVGRRIHRARLRRRRRGRARVVRVARGGARGIRRRGLADGLLRERARRRRARGCRGAVRDGRLQLAHVPVRRGGGARRRRAARAARGARGRDRPADAPRRVLPLGVRRRPGRRRRRDPGGRADPRRLHALRHHAGGGRHADRREPVRRDRLPRVQVALCPARRGLPHAVRPLPPDPRPRAGELVRGSRRVGVLLRARDGARRGRARVRRVARVRSVGGRGSGDRALRPPRPRRRAPQERRARRPREHGPRHRAARAGHRHLAGRGRRRPRLPRSGGDRRLGTRRPRAHRLPPLDDEDAVGRVVRALRR